MSAAAYAEGIGDMTVFTLFVFKQPLQDLSLDLLERWSEIEELNQQIAQLEEDMKYNPRQDQSCDVFGISSHRPQPYLADTRYKALTG